MNTKHSFSTMDTDRMVYVREVKAVDLPDEVRDQIGATEILYAVHRADGERLAVVKERQLAFSLARQNDLAPVTVH